jgi:hypothetical protein
MEDEGIRLILAWSRSTPDRPHPFVVGLAVPASLGVSLFLVVLLALLAWAPAAGAVSYSPLSSFSAGSEPNAVAIAKLNGDANFDLVGVNETSNSVSVLLGGAGGSFGSQTSFPVGSLPDAVTVAKVNGDSNLDLVVANQNSDDISVLFGNGSGSFTPAPSTLVNNVGGIAAADATIPVDSTTGFASTGLIRIDAEVILCSGKTATTFTGCTRGVAGTVAAAHFDRSAVSVTPAGDGPTATAVGNFNGNIDSFTDIAVTNENSNTITILFGGSGGGFTAMSTIPAGISPQSVIPTDFNGDSKTDLVLANEDPGGSNASVMVLMGVGDGTFTTSMNTPYGSRRPTAVDVADFNGDSKQDFAVANYASGDFSVWLGNGNGTFSTTTNPVIGSGTMPVAIAIGDFNRDSKPDLTIANEGANNISVLIGNGNGTFASPINFGLPAGAGPQAIAVGNLNGDSNQDLAVANKTQASSPTGRLGVFFEVPPDTSIGTGPPPLSNDKTPTFTFSSTDGAATFQCKLDGGAFGACSAPTSHTPTISSDGSHTFQVRAVYAGNVDPTPATWTFTIDTVPPTIPTLTGSDPASPANENQPRIIGTADVGTTITLYTTLDCTGSVAATGSAAEFTTTGLQVSVPDNRAFEFYATSTDTAGNTSSCSSEPYVYEEVTPPPPPPPPPPPDPPAPGGGPSGPSGPPDLGAPIKVDVKGPAMAVAGKALKVKANGSVSLSLACPASEPGGCLGRLSLETIGGVRAGKKVKLGKSSFRIAGGKSGSVRLRLSKKNRSLVKKLGKVRVIAIVAARDQVGNAATTRKKLTLKA